MLKFPADLKTARIMISNDDGIHSHGIKVLEESAKSLCPNVWVVAPENEQSAAGHSLTIHTPLRIREYDKHHVSVYGTPTDSVLMGVQRVMKGIKPDLVLSGINHGQNTGDDITYSGTIAAAIEAALIGIPAIAFSHYYDDGRGKPDWKIVRAMLPKILTALQGFEIEENTLLNINFPLVPEGTTPPIRIVRQGHCKVSEDELVECMDPRGRPYFWIGPPPLKMGPTCADDVSALREGAITITPLHLNLTHEPTLPKLEKLFA